LGKREKRHAGREPVVPPVKTFVRTTDFRGKHVTWGDQRTLQNSKTIGERKISHQSSKGGRSVVCKFVFQGNDS